MNDLERFLAVVHFEKPDYVPIFGFPGAPGMSGGCMKTTHDRLVATGMPAHVGAVWNLSTGVRDLESWYRYWGTTGPLVSDIDLKRGVQGFRETRRIEGDFEIIESESGAVTRQVIDNDITYSMPEFIEFPVRDRDSWERYKRHMTPSDIMPPDEMEAHCKTYDDRDRPLSVGAGGGYGYLRSLLGPERLSLTFHDDPELLHDMMDWQRDMVRTCRFPLIERLRPEIVQSWEDCCYNHGMLCSPSHFDTFAGPYYREVCAFARDCGAQLLTIDTDGNAMQFAGVVEPWGINGIYPWEVKAGNDLFAVREQHPEMVLFGWLEKEVVNEGNAHLIEPEITSKVPPLLEKGGYFPNGDHGLQPWVTFENLCKFMTLLHEVTGNPQGEFPRIAP